MGKNLLLYATDSSDLDTSGAILEHMTSWWGNAQGEIVCISPAAAEVPVQRIGDASIKTCHEVCEILTADIIIDYAIQKKASLIALHVADHRYETVIPTLLRKTPVPIVVTKGGPLTLPLMDHVVYATDWSAPSEEALRFIIQLGTGIRELEIIHVINQKLTVKDMRQLKERLQSTRERCLDAGIDAEAHIYAGEVAEEIVTASRDYKATAIVMAARQKRPFMQRLFKKSVPYGVILSSTITVAIVPSKNQGQ